MIVMTEDKKPKQNGPPIEPSGRDRDDEGRMQRTDDSINDKLSSMIGSTYDLPQKDNAQQKFSSRCRLYVGNFADITEKEVTEMFEKYGEINECIVNPEKMFAFVRLDYRGNAERAKRELDGFERKNKELKVRFAPVGAAIKVKNLTQWVTNELLEYAFSIFGEIERAKVLVDDRGNSLEEGIVEFASKPTALLALRRCAEGCFFLTSSLRPVILEPYDVTDDVDGFPEKSITFRPAEYMKAREIGPRFAANGSFEFEYGTRWKQLHNLYKQKKEALKRELKLEEEKLEAQMEYARLEHETEMLRKHLRQLELDREGLKMKWEKKEREVKEQRSIHEGMMRRPADGISCKISAMKPENAENNIIDRIPDEILVKILSHLSAPHIKQARLVCSKWYEASKDILIMKHQKFVFLRYDSPGILLNTLANGNYSCYNLDIEGHRVDAGSTLDERFDSFIESQGSKIYSLRFRNLYFKPSTIEKIFINCINLNELSFQRCDFNIISSVADPIPIANGVQIEHKRLKILELDYCYKLSVPLFKVFIDVYPNVEKLSFVPGYITETPENSRFDYSDVCQAIAEKCKNMKMLNLKTTSTGLTDDDLSIIGTACFKLKELNISGQKSVSEYTHHLQTGMKNFLSQQTNIISLDVSNCDGLKIPPFEIIPFDTQQRSEDYFGFKCFEYLLRQNETDLKHLNIDIAVWPDIPDLLRNTRLKSFQCNIFSFPANAKNSIVMNSHLEKLSINTCRGDYILSILKSFPNLTYLELSGFNSSFNSRSTTPFPSYIFTHLVHLETIILEKCGDWVKDSAFENSPGKLKNLKHLNLRECTGMSKKVIKHFYYPKLKYLNIQGCSGVEHSVLPRLSETSPLLEHLCVNHSYYELPLSMTWKYLRYLFLRNSGYVTEDKMHSIYRWKEHCPSLHYIKMQYPNSNGSFSLTYNPESKQFDKAYE